MKNEKKKRLPWLVIQPGTSSLKKQQDRKVDFISSSGHYTCQYQCVSYFLGPTCEKPALKQKFPLTL